jgi:periplasmic divalent cation tolerance protein
MAVIVLLVPCPTEALAATIADALLDDRLIACGHVRPPHTSRYRWKGAVEREREWTVELVTRADLAGKVERRIRELHPFEVPAILGTRVDHVNADYAAWVREQTAR